MKVVLTLAQAEELEAMIKMGYNVEKWYRNKMNPSQPYSVIHDLSIDEFAKVFYSEDYEIEEPTPQFEPGDLAMIESVFGFEDDKFVTLDKYYPAYKAWTFNGTGKYIPAEKLSKPTQDEIYWLHDLKRDYVNDFKLGDVVKQKAGDLCEVVDMYTGMVEDTYWCTVSDAIRWAEANEIQYIYPVESRKPYRKEEN